MFVGMCIHDVVCFNVCFAEKVSPVIVFVLMIEIVVETCYRCSGCQLKVVEVCVMVTKDSCHWRWS